MPKLSSHFAFLAFIFWLLGNWVGAHGHFCFDGQEPPVSVHMGVISDHVEHPADAGHQDANIDLVQSVLAKLSKVEVGLILLSLLALALLILPTAIFITAYRRFYPRISLHWRPLLRAPPVSV
jgi:hypothetical protein